MNKVSMYVGKPISKEGRYEVRITVPCGNFDFEPNSSMEVLVELLDELREFLACNEEEHRDFERVRAILMYAMTFNDANLDFLRNVRGRLEDIGISFASDEDATNFAVQVPFKVSKHLENWTARRAAEA